MAKKKGELAFIKIMFDDLDAVRETLPKDQAAEVIFAMADYMRGERPSGLSPEANAMFALLKKGLDRARDAYDEKCRVNAENGAKGGKAKARNAQEKSGKVALPKFKAPTMKQFKNAVYHAIDTDSIDSTEDYFIEQFYSELDESGWKIQGVSIVCRGDWETAISERFYTAYRNPTEYDVFSYIFGHYNGLRDSDNVSRAGEAAYFFLEDLDKDGEWVIDDHTYTKNEWETALEAFMVEYKARNNL